LGPSRVLGAALHGFHHVKGDPDAYGCSGAIPVLSLVFLLPFQIGVFGAFFRLHRAQRRRLDWVGMATAVLLILTGSLGLLA
jgi:hypothetical protein